MRNPIEWFAGFFAPKEDGVPIVHQKPVADVVDALERLREAIDRYHDLLLPIERLRDVAIADQAKHSLGDVFAELLNARSAVSSAAKNLERELEERITSRTADVEDVRSLLAELRLDLDFVHDMHLCARSRLEDPSAGSQNRMIYRGCIFDAMRLFEEQNDAFTRILRQKPIPPPSERESKRRVA